MISRRNVLGALAAAPLSSAAPRRPNVIIFMTDDHGAWATSVYGCSEIRTPHLQKLADTGLTFERAFAATPVCSPSRLTYLTGTLPSHHGVQDWLRPEDSFGAKARSWIGALPTYSKLLADAGYDCGFSGKWHMGLDDQAQQGFRYWATVPGGGGPFKDVTFVRNGESVRKPGFKEDAIADFALEFLDDHQQRRPRDPFFLLVPFYAPHTPYDYQPDEDRAPYLDSKFSCYPRTERHPWANRGLRSHHLNEKSMLAYSALITGMDRNIGRILAWLDRTGQRDNTTILFTADQGWNSGQHGFWGKGNGTWPFNMYEESIRVPMIWNHPGRIPAGQRANPMVSSYDLFPSILDWTGIKSPPASPTRPGRSYAGFLRGKPPARWNNRLYFEYSMVRSVRTENLKLVSRTDNWPSELYDLEADPGETKNLIDSPTHARQRAALEADLAKFFSRSGAPPHPQWRSTTKQNLTEYQR